MSLFDACARAANAFVNTKSKGVDTAQSDTDTEPTGDPNNALPECGQPNVWRNPGGDALRLYLDILKQPHTLIAGTTGSGKSVVMNGIIYTALYKDPQRVQFVFIDTKFTELRMYQDLPHTWRYVSDATAAAQVLRSVLQETLNRAKRASAQGLKRSEEADLYVCIDELGDLIFTDRGIINTLARIAMLGRAANVHLIAGTQCPNRKTLSAEFASNCPARVGLRCQDAIESRQIIGAPDAVNLPAHGMAYYTSPDYLRPQLVKIPFYPDEQLRERVSWWTAQAPAQLNRITPMW